MSLTFLNINFHLYGLIIGLALIVGLWLGELKAKQENLSLKIWHRSILVILIGGVVGARVHHLLTDFFHYQNYWKNIFEIWQGGLSIIGGLWGGILAFFLYWRWLKKSTTGETVNKITSHTFWQVLDVGVFALVPAQVIGRLGNLVNQELFGLPTKLPWAVYIDPTKRPIDYRTFSHFHPLFIYEIFLLALFSLFIWFGSGWGWFKKQKIGSGFYTIFYLIYYSFIRFWLDFIRINKIHFLGTNFGFNQIFLLIIILGLIVFALIKNKSKHYLKFASFFIFLLLILFSSHLKFSAISLKDNSSVNNNFLKHSSFADQQIIEAQIGSSPILKFKVVSSEESIKRGLSNRSNITADGMLFVFPKKQRYGFWMKEMKFDLDLIWLNDQRIVDITPNVPAQNEDLPVEELLIYRPKQAVDMVLEVKAGQAEEWKLALGDTLKINTKTQD